MFLPDGSPVVGNSVDFLLQVYDKNGSCLLYSENHNNQDLSESLGGFSLMLGTGSTPINHLSGLARLDTAVFANKGSTNVLSCPNLVMNPGDPRLLRIS